MNIINYSLDEDTVIAEAILPDDKWQNGYRSEKGMTKTTKCANEEEWNNADGDSKFPTKIHMRTGSASKVGS